MTMVATVLATRIGVPMLVLIPTLVMPVVIRGAPAVAVAAAAAAVGRCFDASFSGY